MCIVSCTNSLWLQNENVAVQDEHVMNESAVYSDEENVKVRSSTLLLGQQKAFSRLLSA
jgi:hypothetical protein